MVCKNEVGDVGNSRLCNVAEVVEAHQDRDVRVKECANKENELETTELVLAVFVAKSCDKVGAQKQGATTEGETSSQPVVSAPADGDSTAVEESLAFADEWEVSECRDDADDKGEDSDDRADKADNINNLFKSEDSNNKNESDEDCKAYCKRQVPLLESCGSSTGRHEEEAAESEQPCHGFADLANDGASVERGDLVEVAEIAGAASICISNICDVYHNAVKSTNEKGADNTVTSEVLNGFLT